jgi:hypothetical protein
MSAILGKVSGGERIDRRAVWGRGGSESNRQKCCSTEEDFSRSGATAQRFPLRRCAAA